MIARLLELKTALQMMKIQSNKYKTSLKEESWLKDDDWTLLQELEAILEPFMEVQKELEGDSYVTASLVFPNVLYLREQLEQTVAVKPRDDKEVLAWKAAMVLLKDLKKRWFTSGIDIFNGKVRRGEMNRQIGFHPVFIMATALDPRFKNLIGLKEGEKNQVWECILHEMIEVQDSKKYGGLPEHAENSTAFCNEGNLSKKRQARVPSTSSAAKAKKRNHRLKLIQGGSTNQSNRQLGGQEKLQQELANYQAIFQIPLLIENEEGDEMHNCALEWWKKVGSVNYPTLAKLAQVYLAAQATSAASERIFSKASYILQARRNRMDAESAGNLLFMRSSLGNQLFK